MSQLVPKCECLGSGGLLPNNNNREWEHRHAKSPNAQRCKIGPSEDQNPKRLDFPSKFGWYLPASGRRPPDLLHYQPVD